MGFRLKMGARRVATRHVLRHPLDIKEKGEKKMKIQGEHLKLLQEGVRKLGNIPSLYYKELKLSAKMPNSRIKDVDVRFVWDVFWAVRRSSDALRSMSYQEWDYSDNHIETAMRHILGVAR